MAEASLKTDIIVKSKFTYLRGGRATAGSTPGTYTHQYMARKSATEPITPMRRSDIDDFISRYMARSSAVDAAVELSTEPSRFVIGSSHQGESLVTPTMKQKPASGDSVLDVVDVVGNRDTTLRRDIESIPRPEDVYDDGSRLSLRARRKARSAQRQTVRLERLRDRRGRRSYGDGGDLDMSAQDVHDVCESPQGLGGVSFSHESLSLSHDHLMDSSKRIQDLFDRGHTVILTVLSFDHDYLVRNGVVPKEMPTPVEKGQYRGNVDQMKLRSAINHGLERMAKRHGYDQLEWVGVIQVDTEHVHCHLSLVDAGQGTIASDGSQRGKIPPCYQATLRRGIDARLDEQKSVAFMASAVTMERQNVVSHVKRWVHESMGRQYEPRFLLSLLPENKNHWRAGANRKDMKRANDLCRRIVERRLDSPDSPMEAAMSAVKNYAITRGVREGLSQKQQDQLIITGREQIIERCMNGVYRVLKDIPEHEQHQSTEMMQAMAAPVEDVIVNYAASQASKHIDDEDVTTAEPERSDDDQLSSEEFVLRLRSYTSRLHHHRQMRKDYEAKDAEWQAADARGEASPESVAMHDFYRSEIDYHTRAESKYHHFLRFNDPDVDWDDDWADVDAYGKHLSDLDQLLEDDRLKNASSVQAAEAMGRRLYGHGGAGGLSGTPYERAIAERLLLERRQRMDAQYRRKINAVESSWRDVGGRLVPTPDPQVVESNTDSMHHLSTTVVRQRQIYVTMRSEIYTPGARLSVSTKPEYDFAKVRGVDLHDMRYDWLQDQPVGEEVIAEYERLAASRRLAFDRALLWMTNTGLGEEVHDELGAASDDIECMEYMAAQVSTSRVLPSALGDYIARQRVQRQRVRQLLAEQQRAESQGQEQIEEVIVEQPRHRTVHPNRQITRQLYAAVDLSARDVPERLGQPDPELGE